MISTYEIDSVGSNCRVAIRGALTAILVLELKQALRRELQGGARELVFDLGETSMLDSCGIGLLIASGNTLNHKGGTVRVINPSRDVFQLLSNMRLVSRLHVNPGPEQSHSGEDEYMRSLLADTREHLSSTSREEAADSELSAAFQRGRKAGTPNV